MEYNTSRGRMIIPEYGRNVQKMVDYVVAIEDREKRNKEAHNLIEVIGNLNPKVRDIPDYKHKLWDHMHIMSDFKLEVDGPFPPPSPESLLEKPKIMPYPDSSKTYRHYGNVIKKMAKYLASLEPGEEKEALKEKLANEMKKTYLLWNKDQVEDAVILKEMNALAGGNLELTEVNISEKSELVPKNLLKKKANNPKKRSKRRNKQKK